MTKNIIQFCHFVAERHHPKRWRSFKVQGVCVYVCANWYAVVQCKEYLSIPT